MKALTLTQPWATLVAIGAKRIETRSWRTPYRGTLAIHAAKGFPGWAKETCHESGFRLALMGEDLVTAAVVATCRLVDCVPTKSCFPVVSIGGDVWGWKRTATELVITDQEALFGDYGEDRWAWLLADIKRLPEPIPAKGALGIWEWKS